MQLSNQPLLRLFFTSASAFLFSHTYVRGLLTQLSPPVFDAITIYTRGVPPFGVSGPYWKNSCLGPHVKYIVT